MSLEMIIGLLILLVVAAVVISLFLNSTSGLGNQPYKKALQYRNFIAQCQSLCSDYLGSGDVAAAAKFCYTKLTGDTDLNRNGRIDAFPADTKLLDICEDGVYCFHVYTCNTDNGKLDWGDCRQILCNAYYDVYQDWNSANQKVKAIFPNGIGSCSLTSGEANWYDLYFGANPCMGGASTTQTTTAVSNSPVVSCSKQGTNSISCSYSCPSSVSISASNTVIIALTPGATTRTYTQQSGSDTFSGLTPGTNYGVALVCGSSIGQLTGTTSIQI